MIKGFADVWAGGQLSAGELNRAFAELERCARITATAPLELLVSAAGYQLRLDTSQIPGGAIAKASTSTADSDGYYTAVLEEYDGTTPWTDGSTVKLVTLNSETITSGVRYFVRQTNVVSSGGYPVYSVGDSATGSTGTLTVQETDGSPSITATTLLKVDQSTGLTVQAVGGNPHGASLVAQAASATLWGVVNTSAQTWAGTKTFQDGLYTNVYVQFYDSGVVANEGLLKLFQDSPLSDTGTATLGEYCAGAVSSVGLYLASGAVAKRPYLLLKGDDMGGSFYRPDIVIQTGVTTYGTGQTGTAGGLAYNSGLYTGGTFTVSGSEISGGTLSGGTWT